ncbi:hypothetical protein ElyMa_004368000 [Elysia marginata]|uniref:Uncharacterized protein n=1 Tax=Elysia marginata TaxID=1093978 RepID=A0AAV4H4N0_9GAST|nr:hypothetical protein ElyMa_004368000 [Elysia marginata]
MISVFKTAEASSGTSRVLVLSELHPAILVSLAMISVAPGLTFLPGIDLPISLLSDCWWQPYDFETFPGLDRNLVVSRVSLENFYICIVILHCVV